MTARLTARDSLQRMRGLQSGARALAASWIALRLEARRRPMRTATLALIAALPICLACALVLDVRLVLLARQTPPNWRLVAELFSDIGLSGYMIGLSVLALVGSHAALRRGWLPSHHTSLRLIRERALFVLAVLVASGIVVQILKHVIGRARPGLLDEFGAFYFDLFSLKASLASFPSGHSTSIFALAAALGLIVPRLRWGAFALAVAVALARAVLTAHYASDLLAGAILGTAVTIWVAGLFASRSIAFIRVRGVLRLKGRGEVWTDLRAQTCGSRL